MSILRGFSIKLATRGSICVTEIVPIEHLLSVRAELFETHDCRLELIDGHHASPLQSTKQTQANSRQNGVSPDTHKCDISTHRSLMICGPISKSMIAL